MSRTFIHLFLFIHFVFIANLPFRSFGQQLVYKFKQFTTNDGLPSSEVHQVLRDSRNFMWFATDHGPCRYDGYEFQTFNLPDNSVLSMYEDVKKRIWFVTFSGRLFFYQDGKFNDYKYNDIIVKAIEQMAINRIYVDKFDNVYISTTGPNSFIVDSKGTIRTLFHPSPDSMFQTFEAENGEYFSYVSGSFMSGSKIFFSFPKPNSFVSIKTSKKKYQIKIPEPIIGRKHGLKCLSDYSLVYFAGRTLIRIFEKKTLIKKFENQILDLREIGNESLLVATIQEGLYFINRNNEIVENYFSGLTVTSIEFDYEGGLWISTTQNGVFYLNSLQMKHFSENGAIFNKKILCLEKSDKDVWAGGESGSIYFFNKKNKIYQYQFPIISINGIHTDFKKGSILICAGQFVSANYYKFQFYKRSQANFILVQSISDVIEKNGRYYSGQSTGIIELVYKKNRAQMQSKKNFRVSTLFRDDHGNILVGNLFGLWKYKDGDLQSYDSTKKILNSRITDINGYRDNCLLLGTRGKGFLVLQNDSLYQITSQNGLASDNIRKIFVDENIIWLATNRGLSRLTILSLDPFEYDIKNISVQDGLLSNEVNDIKRLDSNIVVATNGGISMFSRNLFDLNNQAALSLYITGVKINGLDTTINDQYSFNYKYNNLSLSFVALSYRESSNIEYRYRLYGIDSNWINISGREIQLNPIPYGRYAIQIQARREGENWTDEDNLNVDIFRRLPFWKTMWFYILSFLLVAFLMLMFFINRTKQIKQREKERTLLSKKLAEMELKALRAQMNPHFIFNVLNSIQYFITHNKNEETQYYMSKFAKLVRLTLDNSRSTFISLANELSLLKLYIDLEKIRFEDRFEYAIKIEDDLDLEAIKIPNMLLQPYVENSIKHGFKNKEQRYFIDISLSRRNEKIVCIINDNGIGREKAALIPSAEKENHTSTGTIIIQEKIEALKQYYYYDVSSVTEDLKDEKGNSLGTKVVLSFPEKADVSNII